MTYALATNDRTATKAAIKRASAAAQRDMMQLDRKMAVELESLYRQAKSQIESSIMGYADRDSTLRLEVLHQLLNEVNGHLQKLQQARDGLLNNDLLVAAQSGVQPFAGTAWEANLSTVADDVVRWVHTFKAADGLQLSDRLWRLDRGAKDAITQAIQSAVIQGHSASQTAQDFMSRGLPVPADVAANAAKANAAAIANQSGKDLLTGDGSAYSNALRVFRTEINRAHGEAYMASGEAHPDHAGWRFLLSPSHPRPDICDMHASANLYGLGPGVYPSRDKCPWPAHPNTLSFVEIVFTDEISEADREGKTDRTTWIKAQSPGMREAVLGGRMKRGAFDAGVLKENQIATPWNVLKARYEKKGVDIENLTPVSPIGGGWATGESHPVSGALDVLQHKTSVNTALNAIDSVHSDGKLPHIPVKGSVSVNATELGTYRFYASKGVSVDIRISDRGNHKELTAVHEIGHLIDHQGVVPGRFSSQNHELFDAWRKAVDATEAIRKLRSLKLGGDAGEYVNYLLDRREIWARSYAQYITEKSGNNVLAEQLRNILQDDVWEMFPSQWTTEDFEPVKEAIDAAFKDLGWIE